MKRYFFLVFMLAIMSGQVGCNAQEEVPKRVRQPARAGQFYPGDAKELETAVKQFLANVPEIKLEGTPVAIMVPHAGYVFSGQVAAYAYKTLKGADFDTVVIIGHDVPYIDKIAFLYDVDAFRTPLGDVPVDREMVRDIMSANKDIVDAPQMHKEEHSIEVQLPFLQVIKKDFKIVPILFGTPSPASCAILADAILKASVNKKVILIASTDLSHYPTYKDENKIWNETSKSLEKFNLNELFSCLSKLEEKNITLETPMCASGGVGTAILFAKAEGADKVQILKHANSGDIPAPYGDKSRVVGYGSAVFVKTKGVRAVGGKMASFSVSEKNQNILLKLARDTIEKYLKTKKTLHYETDDPELMTPSAVFVTLTIKGQLKGCIGSITPEGPLYQAVQQRAISAAVDDPRFSPVSEKELKDIKIEISVLSPLTRVRSADEIKPRVHGVIVREGLRSGLFLPQVWEHFTNKEDFLSELCSQKAGLNPEAWRDAAKTELYVFTVFAFEEE